MASGFPGAIDSFTDPLTTSALNSPSHAGQHQDLNDAVEKIETYMGLVKVIPTSVSSAGGTAATLAANGTVNVGTTNTSVDINGCFSALYDNYLVSISGVSSASGGIALLMYLKTGATVTTSGFYGNTFFIVTAAAGALTNNAISNQGYAEVLSLRNGETNSGTFVVMQPFLAAYTRTNFSSASSDYWRFGAFTHNSATSYDTLRLAPSSGSISGGSIRVYGYRN